MGLVVKAIVQTAESERNLNDQAAVAALRACLTGQRPSRSESQKVFDSIQRAVTSHDDIHPRGLRIAINDLLKIAANHQSGGAASFLSYLSLVAG